MNKQSVFPKKMVANDKNKVISCSTPEHRSDSPSRDSDSLCDSDAASPVPFLCTQDGAEGETDVVWNFYTPKSGRTANPNTKNSTPISRKSKRSLRPKLIEKQLPKRRAIRSTQKKTELYQELFELNQNLHELIPKKQKNKVVKQQSGSEDDIFHDSPDYSPKSARRLSSHCLRRNVLSSNFGKPETDTALESDDSMNECLLKASQVVEDVLDLPTSPKRICYGNNRSNLKTDIKFRLDNDSMDAILSNVRLESPAISKAKNCNSPRLNDDSFDSLVGNLNDSVLEQLTQMPVKNNTSNKKTDWKVKELVIHDGSPLSKSFGRHNSMPESPSVTDVNKPSTSGMSFGRYSSMPYENNLGKTLVPDDSPIRCTPDEIKKKHQQAREKLLAKRVLPFTSSQASQPAIQTQMAESRSSKFQPKVPSSLNNVPNNITAKAVKFDVKTSNSATDLKLLLEKKRQEALLKLRRRQPQNKIP